MTTELWLTDKNTMKRMQKPIRQGRKREIEASQVEKEIRQIPAKGAEFHFPKSGDKRWKEITIEIGAQGTCEALAYKSAPPPPKGLGWASRGCPAPGIDRAQF